MTHTSHIALRARQAAAFPPKVPERRALSYAGRAWRTSEIACVPFHDDASVEKQHHSTALIGGFSTSFGCSSDSGLDLGSPDSWAPLRHVLRALTLGPRSCSGLLSLRYARPRWQLARCASSEARGHRCCLGRHVRLRHINIRKTRVATTSSMSGSDGCILLIERRATARRVVPQSVISRGQLFGPIHGRRPSQRRRCGRLEVICDWALGSVIAGPRDTARSLMTLFGDASRKVPTIVLANDDA